MHTSKKIAATVAAGVMVALAGAAHAATRTDAFTVSATVAGNCLIDAADMNLGTFDGVTDLTAQSIITVRCTTGTSYTVSLSAGSSGDQTARTLESASGDTLLYNLYTGAAAGSPIWGDGVAAGTDTVTGTGTGMGLPSARELTVHGRLLAADNAGARAGSYSDSITATIEY